MATDINGGEIGDWGMLSDRRRRLRPEAGGEVGDGGMVVDRGKEDMKERNRRLPQWVVRHCRW